MRKVALILLGSVLFSGCSVLPKAKWPSWASMSGGAINSSGTVAEATAGKAAIDRMTEIANREKAAREALEKKYDEFRVKLQDAYNNRTAVDDDNFDRISELNYGIWYITKDLVDTDNRILVANLRSQANMNRLMPLGAETKTSIENDINADIVKDAQEIRAKYELALKEGAEAAAAYEAADQRVKDLEAEKAKLREEEKIVLAKLIAEQDAEKVRLKKEAEDAVAIAKEKQKQEMIGWIVKSLLGVGILILIIGFLMKSPTFIISGIGMLGLAYMAATIPFWVVAALMGLFIMVMIIVDPKTGKVGIGGKKKSVEPQPQYQPIYQQMPQTMQPVPQMVVQPQPQIIYQPQPQVVQQPAQQPVQQFVLPVMQNPQAPQAPTNPPNENQTLP